MYEKPGNKGERDADIECDVDRLAKKAYEKPVLIAYGDVRDITLGPTVGEGESGAALFLRVPPP